MEDPDIEDINDIDQVFVGFDKKKLTKKKHQKKPCPLKCVKETHTNGSLYFCPLFRDKSKEERKLL